MESKPPGKLDMKFLQNRLDQSLNPKNECPPVVSSKKPAFPKNKVPMFVNDRGSIIPPKVCQKSESRQVGQLQQNQLHKTTRPEIPKSTRPEFPKTTKPEFPKTTRPEFPKATKPEFPKTTKPEFPKATKPEFPKTTRPEFPKATKPEFPKTTRPEFPKATKPEFPKTTRPEFPKTTRPEFPKTTQPEFPKTIKPEISNTTRPEITQTKPKPTVKALTNKIPAAFSNELASKLGGPKKLQEQKTPPDTPLKGWTVPSTQTAPPAPPSSTPTDDTQHGSAGRTDSIPLDQAPPPPQEHAEPPVLFFKGRRLPSKVKIDGTTYKLTPLPPDTGESTPRRPLRTPDVVPIVPDDADADEMYVNSSTKYSIAPDSSDEDEGFSCQDTAQDIQRAGYITDENYDDCIQDPNSAQYQHGQYPVDDENYDDCNVEEYHR